MEKVDPGSCDVYYTESCYMVPGGVNLSRYWDEMITG